MQHGRVIALCMVIYGGALQGMQSPEKGSLNALWARHEGLRRQKHPRKIISIEEKNYGILLQYVIVFSTGAMAYSTYSPYDRKGYEYKYLEKNEDNKVIIDCKGQDAKIVFGEYQSFYERLMSLNSK